MLWLVVGFAASASAQLNRAEPVPLAYVRTLVAPSAALATPADPPLPLRPLASKKHEWDRWQSQAAARAATVALRQLARDMFDEALGSRLGAVRGITVTPVPPVPVDIGDAARRLALSVQTGEVSSRHSSALVGYASGLSGSHGADACLLVVVDRFGRNTGLEREVWLRTVAWLWRREDSVQGSLAGPFFAIGRAVAGRKVLGKGFGRTDEELVRDAGTQAANRLAGMLETGRRPLFMDDCRAAVLPAEIPPAVLKSVEVPLAVSGPDAESHQTITIPLSSIHRQRDVLFQPETSPVTILVDTGPVLASMASGGKSRAENVWDGGKIDIGKLRDMSFRLGVDYVFASRIRDVEISDRPDVATDTGQLRAAVRRQADVEVEGILYGAREDVILWSDTVTGGTVAITEYVRHQPRLRSDEQCLADAARTAYAHLRSSFDELRRKVDRETKAAIR